MDQYDTPNGVILRINKANSGSLWHYGHFIHDFIIPLIYYLNKNNVVYTCIYLDYRSEQCRIGTFNTIAQKMLGIPVIEIKKEQIHTLGLHTLHRIRVRTLGFGVYKPNMFKYNISHIKSKLQLIDSPYKIILIVRGQAVLKNNCTTTGATR